MKPLIYTTAAELAARLQVVAGPAPDLAACTRCVDLDTGTTWWVRRYSSPDQVHAEVAAGWLYRACGLAASEWRLVELRGGELAAAQPARRFWLPLVDQAVLEPGAPVDAWLGNLAVAAGSRRRAHLIPGTASVLRLDLSATLGWASLGQRSRAGDWLQVTAPGRKPAHDGALEALGRITPDVIERALDYARTPTDQHQELAALLEQRRQAVLVAARR